MYKCLMDDHSSDVYAQYHKPYRSLFLPRSPVYMQELGQKWYII